MSHRTPSHCQTGGWGSGRSRAASLLPAFAARRRRVAVLVLIRALVLVVPMRILHAVVFVPGRRPLVPGCGPLVPGRGFGVSRCGAVPIVRGATPVPRRRG